MKRKHEMPFGAECGPDGSVRFRLWAPKATSVDLHIPDLQGDTAMSPLGGGWFEAVTMAPAGTRYQFKVDHRQSVPDPASRFQPCGVHGMSEVVDPAAFVWSDQDWRGRSWAEAVLYELHIGTFTAAGTFAAARTKLPYLADLGVTGIELMPLSSFPGDRNWGYDGVLPYAPPRSYGRPEDLKSLVNSAHENNLMVFLDVVYNHFGPEGNYLWAYAPEFFTPRHKTPWGEAINFGGNHSRVVRDYFIHNALYWLEEFYFDGLRFDAVHAIVDQTRPHILTELAETVRTTLRDRKIHLLLENDGNAARFLARDGRACPRWYTAQWNDDIHHAFHVSLTGETDGYYSDYAENADSLLGRCLAEGFAYQGEPSSFRGGSTRGEPTSELPLTSFVSFLQNHDQIGNRALGERIVRLTIPEALRTALAIVLLAPSPPLLFMGEEFGATTPFLFFSDFGPDLADKVREGRRAEFAKFEQFQSAEAQARIPDPNIPATFLDSKLDWSCIENQPHSAWLGFYRELLAVRREKVVPLLHKTTPGSASYELLGEHAIYVRWPLKNDRTLQLLANLGAVSLTSDRRPQGTQIYSTIDPAESEAGRIPAFSAAWFISE